MSHDVSLNANVRRQMNGYIGQTKKGFLAPLNLEKLPMHLSLGHFHAFTKIFLFRMFACASASDSF